MHARELIVNDVALDLGDAALQMERYFKVALFEDAEGSKVFNLFLPATPTNDEALGYRRKLLQRIAAPSFVAQIRYNGVTVFTGLLVIKQTTRLGYEVSIGLDSGSFYYKSKNVKMSDCAYEDLPYYSNTYATGKPRDDSYSAALEEVIDIIDLSDHNNVITNNTNNTSKITADAASPGGWYLLGIYLKYEHTAGNEGTFTFIARNTTTGELLGTWDIPASVTICKGWTMPFWCATGDDVTLSISMLGIIGSVTFTFDSSSRITWAEADMMADLLASNTGTWPDKKFAVFPVHNPDFFPSTDMPVTVLGAEYQNPLEVDTGTTSYDFLHTMPVPITPFFYLAYILQKAVAQLGYNLVHNWQAINPEWMSLVVYNNYDIASRIENSGSVGTMIINAKNHVPDVSVWEFINTICNNLNLIPVWDDAALTVRLEDGELLATTNQAEDWEDGSADYIYYNDEKPGQLKLMQEIGNDAFLSDYSTGVYKDAIGHNWRINDEVANFTDLPATDAQGSVRKVAGNAGLYFYKRDNNTWIPLSTVVPVFTTGADASETNTGCSTLYMTGYNSIKVDGSTEQFYCPDTRFGGQSALHTGEVNKVTQVRLLFYRGEVECVTNVSTVDVPLGSSTPARNERPDTGVTLQSGMNCALWWEAEYFKANSGIIAQRFTKVLAWRDIAKPVEVYKYLTATEMKNVSCLKQYRIHGGLLTVKSIEADLERDGVGLAVIRGYLT